MKSDSKIINKQEKQPINIKQHDHNNGRIDHFRLLFSKSQRTGITPTVRFNNEQTFNDNSNFK